MRLDYERYQLIMKADSVKICTVFERRKSEIILYYKKTIAYLCCEVWKGTQV